MSARRKSSRKGRGALLIIAALFLGSAVLRIVDDGAAIALDLASETTEPAAPALCEAAPDVEALLDAIRAREERAATQERSLTDRTRALEIAEAAVDGKLAELRAAEESLASTMTQSETAAEDDLARLTAVYENMKPKEAATLFAAMDPNFAAGFLGRMRPDSAAQVMAGLEPATAYSISVILAGRNARAPTN